MKLPEHFADFLDSVVDLNSSRITLLETRVDSIKGFITGSDWGPEVISFASQGSWAHGTIIKPVDTKGFDADLVAYVSPVEGFEAKDYINSLAREFRNNGIYADKITSYSHCVTIEYAGDFRVDITPCVKNRFGFMQEEVCNRTENEFEPSAPSRYTSWVTERNQWSGNNGLEKVTRLLKYLRDIKTTFTCPSILLTTLVGNQITLMDQYGADFSDVPTALHTIIKRLDDWLQQNEVKPSVLNPALPAEDLAKHWDDAQYANFREVIHRYRVWVEEAIAETDHDESIKKWRRVFEDDFAKGEAVDRATKVVKALAGVALDFVEAVKVQGANLLSRMPKSFPHMQVLPFKKADSQFPVTIKGYEKATSSGEKIREIRSGQPGNANLGIEFHALQATGLPFPSDYFVKWQVVNTDRAAANENCLRGEFSDSNSHGIKWETKKYRGVHWIQAFVVNARTKKLHGASERFFVVIE